MREQDKRVKERFEVVGVYIYASNCVRAAVIAEAVWVPLWSPWPGSDYVS